jgi:2-methylcitrate dehydratase PrpD
MIPGEREASKGNTLKLSRRTMIHSTGLALGSAPFVGLAATAPRELLPANSDTARQVMPILSMYMSGASKRVLPDEVVEKTKHHIIDTFAAMLSGSRLLPGQRAVKFAETFGGKGDATVAASNIICSPIEAALANGMLGHADETDDSHAPSQCHPGCAVVPAAFAVGEQFAIPGEHFLRAVALGYDIGPRVTMTLGGQEFESRSHWSTHSIAPLFGAAAAAGCAARLNAKEMSCLLGYTAHQSSGLGCWNRDSEHVQKSFHFGGMTARSGVTSALVVQAGWTGIDDVFSGKDNFFAAYNPQADPAGLIEKLGERYEITRTNIKKWPVGSPIQAALDALAAIRSEKPFEPDQVREIRVRLATDEAAIVNNREIPDICLQHLVAVMLLDKTVSFASAHDRDRLKDAATLHERSKVQLVPDSELEELMPLRVAIVEVVLTDGSRLTRRVDNVRGTAKNPMTTAEVVAKARELVSPILGTLKTANLIEKLLHLESVRDVREFRPLLQSH